jgi:hypothetical protein
LPHWLAFAGKGDSRLHDLIACARISWRIPIQDYLVNRLNTPLLAAANALALLPPLRTLDALHLASALDTARIFKTMPIFVSGDRPLLSVAIAEGFPTDDPNNH